MEKQVLIASSHQPFADLIRHSLLESKKYKLKVVGTKEELQTITDQQSFDLVILDADLPDQPIVSAAAALKQENMGVKLVVFPPDNQANHPSIQGIDADAFLKKPFYLPELHETLEAVLAGGNSSHNNGFENDEEVDPEALHYQYLLSLIMHDSPASAIMLVKDETPYAFVGDLEQNTPQQILDMILPHWNAERRKDVVRFKRLQDGGKDYLFYATAFGDVLILVVVYERTISLTSARFHTTAIIRQLKNPPAIWISAEKTIPAPQLPLKSMKPVKFSQEADLLTTDDLDDFLTDGEELGDLDEAEMIRLEELLASMPTPDPDAQDVDFEFDEPERGLWEIETSDPNPEPELTQEIDDTVLIEEDDSPLTAIIEENSSSESIPEELEEDLLDGVIFPWDEQPEQLPSDEVFPATVLEDETLPDQVQESELTEESLQTQMHAADDDLALSALLEEKNAYKRPSLSKFESSEESEELLADLPEVLLAAQGQPITEPEPGEKQLEEDFLNKPAFNADVQKTQVIRKELPDPRIIPADYIAVDPLEDTAPRIIRSEPEPELEPHSAGLSSLNYTCVLLPRFLDQYLTGLIAENLANWMPQLCIAYGWRLERISIRPQYMQWTLQVAPNVSPGHMVRILREETSRRIFKIKPELQMENPSNDYWAPGYLVMSGFLPPTQQVLVDFIKQTRRRQGLDMENDGRLTEK